MKPNSAIMLALVNFVACACIAIAASESFDDDVGGPIGNKPPALKPVKFRPAKQAKSTPVASDIYTRTRTTKKETKKQDKTEDDEGSKTVVVPDIDASVRQRIAADSKRVSRIAESLVGVQGDINRVEKEVLGKVFDMSTMKTFLDKHETAIKDHEIFEKQEKDLSGQAISLTRQLDQAINETNVQDKKHRATMASLSSKVAEDKAVIQGLQKELVPLVEMEKEVEKFPAVNANLTAQNTQAVAAAQAATQELIYEKSKLQNYQRTTQHLMKELVKQHDYATKCHTRLTQLNRQIHDVQTEKARMKYEQGRVTAKGEAMSKFLQEKNAVISARLKKAKTNLNTINFAKANTKAKIKALQIEGQLNLEKMKAELGQLRMQSASIETAMMAKVTNRKLIEKALRGANMQIEDMQARLVAGRLEKLRTNNSQMTNDLNEIRTGLQRSQIATAKAEAQKSQLLALAAQMRKQAEDTVLKTQDVAREALAKVVATKQSADAAVQKAQTATLQAEASMLSKCSEIWEKEHPKVKDRLKVCGGIKMDLAAAKASVASLTSSVKSSQVAP